MVICLCNFQGGAVAVVCSECMPCNLVTVVPRTAGMMDDGAWCVVVRSVTTTISSTVLLIIGTKLVSKLN